MNRDSKSGNTKDPPVGESTGEFLTPTNPQRLQKAQKFGSFPPEGRTWGNIPLEQIYLLGSFPTKKSISSRGML